MYFSRLDDDVHDDRHRPLKAQGRSLTPRNRALTENIPASKSLVRAVNACDLKTVQPWLDARRTLVQGNFPHIRPALQCVRTRCRFRVRFFLFKDWERIKIKNAKAGHGSLPNLVSPRIVDLKSSKAPHPLLRATAGGVYPSYPRTKLLGKLHHLFDGSIEMGLLNRWAA